MADRLQRPAIAALGLLFARQSGAAGLVVFGVLLTCVNNWMSVAFHAYQPELFPTRCGPRRWDSSIRGAGSAPFSRA